MPNLLIPTINHSSRRSTRSNSKVEITSQLADHNPTMKTGKDTQTKEIWDGMAWRILPSIPKSQKDCEKRIMKALESPSMFHIFHQLIQISNAPNT